MAGGAQAYPAGHIAHGVRDLLSMSPLGIGMSAADLLHAKNTNDPMGAAAAAIGMVPGLKPEVQAVRQGIRAYHGSPHDFDKFDIKKIGSGEGAQAYGHGLYFAENEKVARGYREALADHDYTNPQIAAASYLKDAGGNYEEAIRRLAGHVQLPDGRGNFEETVGQKALALLHNKTKLPELVQPGYMYEVNINAKPEQFLDWDKPVGQQPQTVKDFLVPYFRKQGVIVDPFARTASNYDQGAQMYGGIVKNSKYTEASKEAGIPGIRYLDQGSRFAQPVMTTTPHGEVVASHYPEKTSNYVLFNDQLVDIMRKYGLAGVAATGTAASVLKPQEASATKARPAQFQQPTPLSDRINQMIDSLQWGDQWQGRMRLPLEYKVNTMLGESVWPPLR